MGFITWMSEALQYWAVYYQIASDTGWLAVQQQQMAFVQQELHDRLVAWIERAQ